MTWPQPEALQLQPRDLPTPTVYLLLPAKIILKLLPALTFI